MRAALRERARSRDTQRRDDESDNHYFQDARHFHEPSSFCFRRGLWRPDLNRKRFTDAFFSHPVVSLCSSPCSGGIRRFAECFTFCRKNNHAEIRDFLDSRESDDNSLRRSACFKARQKEIQYGDQLPGSTSGTGELYGRRHYERAAAADRAAFPAVRRMQRVIRWASSGDLSGERKRFDRVAGWIKSTSVPTIKHE